MLISKDGSIMRGKYHYYFMLLHLIFENLLYMLYCMLFACLDFTKFMINSFDVSENADCQSSED